MINRRDFLLAGSALAALSALPPLMPARKWALVFGESGALRGLETATYCLSGIQRRGMTCVNISCDRRDFLLFDSYREACDYLEAAGDLGFAFEPVLLPIA